STHVTTYWNHFKLHGVDGPQLSKMQRIRDYRMFSLQRDICFISPLERLREQCGRQDRNA
ncbi:hypothetical protein STEG23_023462, partial [Scotinomys teguina]